LARSGCGVREIGRLLGVNKNRVMRVLQSWRKLDPIPVSQSLPLNW
jgi:transposase-like protein